MIYAAGAVMSNDTGPDAGAASAVLGPKEVVDRLAAQLRQSERDRQEPTPASHILTPEQIAAAGLPDGADMDERMEQSVLQHLARDGVLAYTRETRRAAVVAASTLRMDERLAGALYHGREVLNIPKPAPLIDGILDTDSLAIMYGPTQSGKSFIALDMLLCVAAGIPWQGKSVRQGRALYVAAEGTGDIRERVAAWRAGYKTANIDDADFLTMPVNLFDEASVNALVSLVVRGEYVFIVIDTLARSMAGGDENSAKDAAIVIAAADALRTVAGACIQLVHHSGYDATHARGSTAFRSASDTELSVKRTPDGLVILKAEKQKTRADGDKWFLKLAVRESSLAVEQAHDNPAAVTANALDALRALADNDDGTGLTPGEWRSVIEGSTSTFLRQRKQLADNHLVAHTGKGAAARYSVTDEGRAALPAEDAA